MLTEDEINENYAKQGMQSTRNAVLQYEYELTFVACGYKVEKQNNELINIQRKKNCINRLKYCEKKIICICIDVCEIYQDDDFDEFFNVLSALKIGN